MATRLHVVAEHAGGEWEHASEHCDLHCENTERKRSTSPGIGCRILPQCVDCGFFVCSRERLLQFSGPLRVENSGMSDVTCELFLSRAFGPVYQYTASLHDAYNVLVGPIGIARARGRTAHAGAHAHPVVKP